MKRIIPIALLLLIVVPITAFTQPVRLAVAGISHGHNSWILGRKNDSAVQLVGI